MIDINNFESYLFLYHEGELDAQERAEVERFLDEHPDIKEEDELYYDPSFKVPAAAKDSKVHTSRFAWRWAAAACALLAVGSSVFFLAPEPGTVPKAAETVATVGQKPVIEMAARRDLEPAASKALEPFGAKAMATEAPLSAASEPALVADAATEEMMAARWDMEPIRTGAASEALEPFKAEAAMSHHDGELIIIETNLLAQVLPAEADVVEVDFLAEVISTEPGRELVSNIAHTIMDIPNLPNKLLASFMQKIKDEVI